MKVTVVAEDAYEHEHQWIDKAKVTLDDFHLAYTYIYKQSKSRCPT